MSLRRLFSFHNIRIAIVGVAMLACPAWIQCAIANAQQGTAVDEKTWEPHDLSRPKPVIRDPGPGTEKEFAKPPNDAIVLFDGKDLSQWVRRPGAKEQPPMLEPKWKVVDGYFEVVPNSGSIYTKEKFEDCRIHVEWATPASFKPQAKGQNRGNSGLFLLGHPELQILDSFENETYADGQAAAIYGKYPPLFNVSRRPGEWQSFDITLEQPRLDSNRKVIKPCTLTVIHNGVLVQDHVAVGGNATSGTLGIQDHYTPVRFRNIWVQKLQP
jgi:hypothetical protein